MAEPIYQDVMGQFPQLKSYNHGLAMFSMSDETTRESIVEAVEAATAKIVSKIPWLGEQVIHVGKEPGNSGTFRLAPWPTQAPPNTLVRVKDCSDLCPTHDEILKAKGPASMLDGNIICPIPGFPMTYDEAKIGPAPAVIVQINWIKGGVLLVFSNQHNVMDASGMFQFIALLSTAMNGKEIPESAIEWGNKDRSRVVPLYGPDVTIRDHNHMRIKTPAAGSPAVQPPVATVPPTPVNPASWEYFRFFKSAIPRVKAEATDPVGYDKSVPFISSNDALSAFYWKHLALARVKNGQDTKATSKFGRAVDARAAMGLSHEYMGQLVYFASAFLTYQELVDLPLSAIASLMRKELNEANNEWAVRSYVTFLSTIQDKTTIMYGGPFNRATDIGSSSMATAAVVIKFGILGVPELIRRPNLAPLPGVLYFYPPDGNGDLNMHLCLTKPELEAMMADPVWSSCTEHLG